jgi:hypothetical protein
MINSTAVQIGCKAKNSAVRKCVTTDRLPDTVGYNSADKDFGNEKIPLYLWDAPYRGSSGTVPRIPFIATEQAN